MKYFLVSLLFICSVEMGYTQWKSNTSTPTVVSAAPDFQYAVLYSIDDNANSFYVWADYRDNLIDLYAQKLDAKGTPQWTKDGLRIGRILDKSTFIYTPKLIKPDGKGGAYILWHRCIDVNKTDRRNLYAQYVSSEGKAQWAADGVKVTEQELTSDDANDGVLELNDLKNDKLLITFNNFNRTTNDNVVYTKKLNYSGAVIEEETKLLQAKGLETKVIYDEKNSKFLALVRDPNADYSFQTFDTSNKEILPLTAALPNPFNGKSRIDMFKVDTDGNAIVGRTISGEDKRTVFVHKINKDGKNLWGISGVNLGSNSTFDVQIIPTSDGGGFATWIETGDKSRPFQKAKINANGNIIWKNEVFTPRSDKAYFLPNKLISDGKDGVYTLWLKPKDIGYDLTVQHFDANGNPKFGEDGVAIKDYTFYSDYRLMLHPKNGGVIVLYGCNKEVEDGRGGSVDLYTNYFTENGKFGLEVQPSITLSNLSSNSFCAGQSFTVAFTTADANFNLDNNFRILLSDKTGSFDKAIEIGRDPRRSVNVKTAQDLESGTYKVKVVSTSPIIESTNTLDITVGQTPPPVIAADKLSICAGGNEKVTLTSSSCKDGVLKWSNSSTGTTIAISPVDNTTYTATCAVAGCKESSISNALLIQAIKLAVTASNSGPYFEGELLKLSSNATSGTAPLKYEWSGPNGFAANIQNPSILNIGINATGTYTVKVTDANNCFGTAQTEVKVSAILANEPLSKALVNVFPNPVAEQLNVSFELQPNKALNITILDSRGRIVEQRKINALGGIQQEKFDIRNLVGGQYFLKINTSEQEVVKKIIISQ
ncbi:MULTISPECIES: T9SS type A sorting domain-containing protein [Emticicia]|uniref:T9SS type A sorting domain-containing protein n=1 Tax=Emticicia TaxID=312278 RepID=UPI0012E73715|nr:MULTISPECIES: T9SS type A sorting domain-containing protein [Emticicia]